MNVKHRIVGRSATRLLLAASAALLLVVVGCGGGSSTTTTPAVVTTTATTPASSATQTTSEGTTTTTSIIADSSMFSTFKSKDPFVTKIAVATATTLTGQTTTTVVSATTTTTAHSSSTTTTTSTSGGTTTTTQATTTTTHPSEAETTSHSLKILSIDVANGVPVVTFEVDGVVYQNKPVGTVVSTSWGQIKVVAIDADTQTVTLLHGSETRVMSVGQQFLK